MTKEEQREADRIRVAKRREAAKLPSAPIVSEESKRNTQGLETNPDKFQGLNPNSYYQNLCIFCGSPETKLMSRNGFSGYLCHSHSFE